MKDMNQCIICGEKKTIWKEKHQVLKCLVQKKKWVVNKSSEKKKKDAAINE